ncbi:MAG: hypothetical protein M5U12_09985 [Verrucomicrobia bacterium]|nr:hypothetical protein [Verrucomicrobiota bacterium]
MSAWMGQEIALRATLNFGACTVKAVNLEGQLTAPTRDEILALKVPPPLELTPKATLGTLSLPADGLRPADIRYVGGKAANFGLLRRSIPTNSSPALAFTFRSLGRLSRPDPARRPNPPRHHPRRTRRCHLAT